MANYTKKMQPIAAGVLQPGEVLLAGCRANAKGTTNAAAVGGAFGLIGGAVAVAVMRNKAEKEEDGDDVAGSIAARWPKEPQVAIGLTDRRLLVWKRSMMTAKPTELIAEFPREQVTSLTAERGKLSDPMTILFADGSAVLVEVVRIDGARRIVAAAAGNN